MGRHIAIGASVLGALALVAVVANVVLGESEAEGQTDGPVISLGEDSNVYPAAELTGRLRLVEGCLILGDSVVFWPHGTTWNGDRQAVGFGSDFEGSADASVGENFIGGGGHYSVDNVRDTESLDANAVLRCIRKTNADDAVIVYPTDS